MSLAPIKIMNLCGMSLKQIVLKKCENSKKNKNAQILYKSGVINDANYEKKR